VALRVTRTPRAAADLLALWIYIADNSEAAADRMLDAIEETLAMLANYPRAGRLRSEISDGLRSFPVGRYIVFYRTTLTDLVLTRILGAAQDIDAIEFE
jgi:toxin ParE1/3/4